MNRVMFAMKLLLFRVNEGVFKFSQCHGAFDATCKINFALLVCTFIVRDGIDDELSESGVTYGLMDTNLQKVVCIDNLPIGILQTVNIAYMLRKNNLPRSCLVFVWNTKKQENMWKIFVWGVRRKDFS